MTTLHEIRGLFDVERERFERERRVMSFDEYVTMFLEAPQRHARDAARYLRDLFDHYGTSTLQRPYGRSTRWNLFDLPWEDEDGRRDALVGQEPLQAEVYRCLSNFAQQGTVNRLMLLHGPNGSAKSTLVSCMQRAMEDYSCRDEGALYRFHWVFPRGRGTDNARIGFGFTATESEGPRPGESYAHLAESEMDAKVLCEVRDHPLLLLPLHVRAKVLRDAFPEASGTQGPPALFARGGLCHKCRQIFESLYTAYRGDLGRVMAHVQVERWYVSRRYREGAVTLGPQMAVDAKERQVTASRSLSALPPSLQNTTLFEPFGELVDAAGGLIEYSDLLKRPLEAWKYLLLMIETGEISLSTSILAPNEVLIGSSNEVHLDAFREHPEYASFRGRLELVRAPYLLDWHQEADIYRHQALPGVRRHVAPHAVELAAVFAVLTRIKRPHADRYPKPVSGLVADLGPMEKVDLIAEGVVPTRFGDEQSRELRAAIERVFHETDTQAEYEGRAGASPREIRGVILDAAQHPDYKCLSPFAVLDKLTELCGRKAEFEWLKIEPAGGGYHDTRQFLKMLRGRLHDHLEDAVRSATGLVDEARYVESFERYVMHVSSSLKGERILNRVTNRDEPADQTMMKEVERMVGATGPADEFRKNLISRVAAWAIDHPGEKVPYTTLFPQHMHQLKEVFFQERRRQIVAATRDVLALLGEQADGLDAEARRKAEATVKTMRDRFGYCDHCARDAVAALLKERFADAAR